MSEKLITLTTLSNPRAQLLRARLANENVEAILTNIHQIKGSVPAAKVIIREKDLPVAMRLLRLVEQEYGPDEVEELGKEDIDWILIPVDFTGVSERAASFAITLAAKINADIKLMHAYFNPEVGTAPINETPTYTDAMSGYLSDLHVNARSKLEEMSNDLSRQIKNKNISDVNVDYYLTMGDPASEILRVSKQYKPNVIVMPIRHDDEKEDTLIGSVTADVIESSKNPVLAIPEQFAKPDVSDIINIAYVTTYDPGDLNAVKNLMRLVAPIQGANIHILQICEKEQTEADKYQMHILQEFFQRFDKVNFSGKSIICKGKKAVEDVNEYVEKNDIHLLSLVSHKTNFITRLLYPGIARRMVFHTKIPLLVFPSEKK